MVKNIAMPCREGSIFAVLTVKTLSMYIHSVAPKSSTELNAGKKETRSCPY